MPSRRYRSKKRHTPTRMPYSCHAQFGTSGSNTCPVGAGKTWRAIGREMSQTSRLTMVHTTRRAPPGNLQRRPVDDRRIRRALARDHDASCRCDRGSAAGDLVGRAHPRHASMTYQICPNGSSMDPFGRRRTCSPTGRITLAPASTARPTDRIDIRDKYSMMPTGEPPTRPRPHAPILPDVRRPA